MAAFTGMSIEAPALCRVQCVEYVTELTARAKV